MQSSIAGIRCDDSPPTWRSSTPTPDQQLEINAKYGLVSDYRDYDKDSTLEELLKDKTVAYVCPSPHLENLGMGEFIDSHDVVVRVNQNFKPTESTWSDYGKRTDILVNCLNEKKRNALHNNRDYVSSLKFILGPMVSVWEKPLVDSFLESTTVPHQNVCDGYLFKMFKEIGTTANTGLTGLLTLLNYPIKHAYLTGMTFFNMNKMGRIYHDSYHDEAVMFGNFTNTPDRRPSVDELRMDIHEQEPQINYFKKLIQAHYPHRLKLDDYLMEAYDI